MIAIGPIADKLTTAGLARVLGVVEYAAQKDRPAILPAHFVVPRVWTAAPNQTTGVIDQFLTEEFDVVSVIQGAAARAGRPAEDLKTETDKVMVALIGWTPPGAVRPIEAVRGQLIDAREGWAAWAQTFRTHSRKRTNPQ